VVTANRTQDGTTGNFDSACSFLSRVLFAPCASAWPRASPFRRTCCATGSRPPRIHTAGTALSPCRPERTSCASDVPPTFSSGQL